MDENYAEIIGKEQIIEPEVGDAGIDLIAASDPEFLYDFGELKLVRYKTGVKIAQNCERVHGFVFPRSSICNYDLTLANSVGVIDSSYRGEIILNFRPLSVNSKPLDKKVYQKGDKIAQLIFFKPVFIELIPVDKFEISDTVRGDGGFGSTGK